MVNGAREAREAPSAILLPNQDTIKKSLPARNGWLNNLPE
jgi:hypothetical protein